MWSRWWSLGGPELLLLASAFAVYGVTSKQELSNPSWFSFFIALGVAAVLVFLFRKSSFLDRFLPHSDGRILALIRIATAGTLLVHLLFLMEFVETIRLPSELIQRDGFLLLEYLPGYSILLDHPELQVGMYVFAAIALLLSLLGYRTKVFLLLSVFLYMLARGFFLHYYNPSSPGILGVYVLAALALLPCADRYSLDAYRNKKKPKQSEKEYGFSLYIIWIVIVCTYLSLGLSKLRDTGFAWASADSIRGHLLDLGYRIGGPELWHFFGVTTNDLLVRGPDVVFLSIGIFVLVLQLVLAPLALFSAYARIVFSFSAALFSIVVFVVMDIIFPVFVVVPFVAFAGYWYIYERKSATKQTMVSGQRHISRTYQTILFCVLVLFLFQWHAHVKRLPLSPWNLVSLPPSYGAADTWQKKRTRVHFADGTFRQIDPDRVLGIQWYPRKCNSKLECEVFFSYLEAELQDRLPEKNIEFFTLDIVTYVYNAEARTFEPAATTSHRFRGE